MKSTKKRNLAEWETLARRRIKKMIRLLEEFPGLKKLGPKSEWTIDFALVGSTEMIRLNQTYRGKNYPTDVLSFPAFDLFRESGMLGQLVICLPTLKRQAQSLGHSPEIELDVLLIHGILHLLGLDHEKDSKQAVKMARWESKILQKLGRISKVASVASFSLILRTGTTDS